ncbi:MAG: methyltransferase domain-containing protein [Pseudomonadota bacterium]|nr:methyltransferase domain-containing protein [Pseudomonadota bacterium]
MSNLEYVDPTNTADKNLWVKAEHLGRYLWAKDLLVEHNATEHHLDLGCATGYGLDILKDIPESHLGLDYDETAVASALDKGVNAQTFNLDKNRLTDLSQTFSSVTAFEVMEHFNDAETVVSDVFASLKQGGLFLSSVPSEKFEKVDENGKPANIHHDRIFKDGEYESILKGAGFKVLGVFGQPQTATLPTFEKSLTKSGKIKSRLSRNPALQEMDALTALTYLLAYPEEGTEALDKSYTHIYLAQK